MYGSLRGFWSWKPSGLGSLCDMRPCSGRCSRVEGGHVSEAAVVQDPLVSSRVCSRAWVEMSAHGRGTLLLAQQCSVRDGKRSRHSGCRP